MANSKDEFRQQQARDRLRLPMLMTMLQPSLDSWEYGIQGGKTVTLDKHKYTYIALDVTEKERKVIRMFLGRIKKRQTEAIRDIGPEVFQKLPRKFFDDADERITIVEQAAIKSCPEGTSLTDLQRVVTYAIYSILSDYLVIYDGPESVWKLLEDVGRLGNYLMPHGSPLIDPMNDVYWDVRGKVIENCNWYEWDGPSKEEILREQERNASNH